ncbi:CRISPR-associated helicase Cas3' [Bifidobacterium samirii]|uniref:CRISPR-associated helicase/endonuclease Cas3 n=1 Tax=Bifidobacterium samirii TaxID=2306974 RepID=A0A430FE97_9BIFI|nr:CRISPR-associated helicase Cas3' [Bifidobacterium samirii]RSX51082.1 CRISPR-associated helicase/endonuclease Cas3 [Bifidobacterium samirii]
MERHFQPGRPALSRQALSIWAKSVYQNPQDNRYLQLWQHMEDTYEIALRVWDDFIPDDIIRLLVDDIGDRDSARTLYGFIAASHDVGKTSPAFEVQVPAFADKVRAARLSINPSIAHDELRRQYRHELVGCWAMEDWLAAQGLQTGTGTLAHGVAGIIAGHHGTSLTAEKQRKRNHYRYEEFAGGQEWETVRFELLDWIAGTTSAISTLTALEGRPLRRRSQILLTALVIIADWIASDSRLFPLNESETDDYGFNPAKRAARAWRMLSLPKPWTAMETTQSADELFSSQFDIPGAKLRPVQREAVRMAQETAEPGLMIIEANMGEGKTEAALLAAEILSARFHCGGVYYALPTQATVNAMFTRILDWIAHLPASERCAMASLFLAHGKRELNDSYEDLRERWFDEGHGIDDGLYEGQSIGFVDMDDCEGETDGPRRHRSSHAMQAVVNSWLTGRKRGNLSNFVVGTIDQVLMAGLRSKHVVLRHMALAGKVVILDEIHSNTAYMNVYMETVLAWLGAYGVPVIMLSATLPQSRRQAFLESYRRGAEAADSVERMPGVSASVETIPQSVTLSRLKARRVRRNDCKTDTAMERRHDSSGRGRHAAGTALDLRYPLISLATAKGARTSNPEPSGRALDVEISLMGDDDEALVSLLRENLRDGGCAVVIRDTVDRAQHTYDVLSRHMDMDVTLAHSRFLAFDRAQRDRSLIERYGKHGVTERRTGIVVATQVVEQSLDVDFDLMVTDIAPIDLILQRAGRLHRHNRGAEENERPRSLRQARMIVTGVEACSDGKPPEFAKGLESVYQRYLLMRSLAVLHPSADASLHVRMPDDIPRLVQTVYGDVEVCPRTWVDGGHGESEARAAMLSAIANSEDAARSLRIFNPQSSKSPFALDGWLYVNVPDPDTPGCSQERLVSAGVREGDDCVEVIVLQQDTQGNLQLPTWGDFSSSDPLPTGIGVPDKRQVRDILSCTISLGGSSLKYCDIDAFIETLEREAPEQWHVYMDQNRNLDGQLLVVLDEQGDARYTIHRSEKKGGIMKTLHFHYSKTRGWTTDVE